MARQSGTWRSSRGQESGESSKGELSQRVPGQATYPLALWERARVRIFLVLAARHRIPPIVLVLIQVLRFTFLRLATNHPAASRYVYICSVDSSRPKFDSLLRFLIHPVTPLESRPRRGQETRAELRHASGQTLPRFFQRYHGISPDKDQRNICRPPSLYDTLVQYTLSRGQSVDFSAVFAMRPKRAKRLARPTRPLRDCVPAEVAHGRCEGWGRAVYYGFE
jgi:hypothetical protein